jgi:arylsulfatase A-like enzyme
MVRAYDESLAALDAELGRLLATLERDGSLGETIIVVTADHGEHFGENGLVEHGSSLYYSALHVPLILYYATGVPAGARIAQPVSLRDLSATILDLAKVDGPGIPGAPLRTVWETGSIASVSPALSMVTGLLDHPPEAPISRGDMAAVVVDSMMLIRNGNCERELYNVVRDARNEDDLSARDRARLQRLSTVLDSLAPANPLGEHRCGALVRRD